MSEKTNERSVQELLEDLNKAVNAGDVREAGVSFGSLGRAMVSEGRQQRAALYFESALTIHRSQNDPWGALLDLRSQGEALLGTTGDVATALSCLSQAAEIGEALKVPEGEDVRARYEVILRMIEEKNPEQVQVLKAKLQEDPEGVRAAGIEALLESGPLATAYFDDQLAVATVLGDAGGIFFSLGSLSQVLIDGGEYRAAHASLELAKAQIPSIEMPRQQLEDMMMQWRAGVRSAIDQSGQDITYDGMKPSPDEDLEALRRDAVQRLTSVTEAS